jgi:spore maturation protein SpmB
LLGAAGLTVASLSGLCWWAAQAPAGQIAPLAARLGNGAMLLAAVVCVGVGWWRRVPVFDAFVEGASAGFKLAVELIPYVIAMLLAIGLLRVSGAFGLLQDGLTWLVQAGGWDAAWVSSLPQGVMKSFSGAGARAFMLDTFKVDGPDSFLGHLSAVVQGASDTTFYILAVCAGAARLRHLGHAVAGAVWADGVSYAVAVALAYALFT